MSTYELPLGSSWVKIEKGDLGKIRDLYLVLTSTPQDENIGVLITTSADPNVGPEDPIFLMRGTFTATTDMTADQNVWIKNFGTAPAALTVVLGGENV